MNSIVLVGACSFAIASLSLIGVGQAEAFQLAVQRERHLLRAHVRRDVRDPAVRAARRDAAAAALAEAASLSGLLMTLLYIVLSVFPIIKVESVSTFALKITLVIVVMNLVGVGILSRRAGGRRGLRSRG